MKQKLLGSVSHFAAFGEEIAIRFLTGRWSHPALWRRRTPAEEAALRLWMTEREIAWHHRRGLRQIQEHSWLRPARINLGSGNVRKDGFLNIDVFPGGDVTLDLRLGLPFESNCCEMVFSEHFFEHVEYPEPISLLMRECHRVLAPGGTLRFSVPDTEWPLNDYSQGSDASYFAACKERAWHPADCTTRLEHINYHFRQGNEHRFAYDEETARKLLENVGFEKIARDCFDPRLDAEHRRIGSLFLSARKPE